MKSLHICSSCQVPAESIVYTVADQSEALCPYCFIGIPIGEQPIARQIIELLKLDEYSRQDFLWSLLEDVHARIFGITTPEQRLRRILDHAHVSTAYMLDRWGKIDRRDWDREFFDITAPGLFQCSAIRAINGESDWPETFMRLLKKDADKARQIRQESADK